MGLVKGERVMTDGTLFQANASLDSLVPKNKDEVENENRGISILGIKAPSSRKLRNKTHVSTTDPDASLAFKSGTPRTLNTRRILQLTQIAVLSWMQQLQLVRPTNRKHIYSKLKH